MGITGSQAKQSSSMISKPKMVEWKDTCITETRWQALKLSLPVLRPVPGPKSKIISCRAWQHHVILQGRGSVELTHMLMFPIFWLLGSMAKAPPSGPLPDSDVTRVAAADLGTS